MAHGLLAAALRQRTARRWMPLAGPESIPSPARPNGFWRIASAASASSRSDRRAPSISERRARLDGSRRTYIRRIATKTNATTKTRKREETHEEDVFAYFVLFEVCQSPEARSALGHVLLV